MPCSRMSIGDMLLPRVNARFQSVPHMSPKLTTKEMSNEVEFDRTCEHYTAVDDLQLFYRFYECF